MDRNGTAYNRTSSVQHSKDSVTVVRGGGWGGGVSVLYMNPWNKQYVYRGTRTNREGNIVVIILYLNIQTEK
jgi:hypothetical protein